MAEGANKAGGTSAGTGSFAAEMQALQQESMQESLIEAQTNEAINRNNGMAQAANGVGRT
jgi:hypothetical protein